MFTDTYEEKFLVLRTPSSSRKPKRGKKSPQLKHNWRRMFDEETACDITIDVDGMLIKAHKSVLISRCQYFAAMFSGKSCDSINIMYLDGFSFECVHFAMCQIYSGQTVIPSTIDIFELADLADLLCLEGLKEMVTHILELEYFHEFHKPCEDCAFLISKFLPWSGAIGYADIYYKILFWIKQYCDEIWSKKEFALLPYEVIQKCFSHHALDIDSENVIEMMKSCDKLMYTLPKVTWTAIIFRFALRWLRECVRYIKLHLVEVLSTESFMALGKTNLDTWIRLEDRLTAAIERANPVQVCAAYAQLHRLLRLQQNQSLTEWCNLLTRLTIHCEDALISCASKAMNTSAWFSLQPDLQARIQKSSGILNSNTYSTYIQNSNRLTRERNVEKLKFILHSRLGNINKVPVVGSRQNLPSYKPSAVVPGNSMVSSTKTTNNLKTLKSNIPVYHKTSYKNIKSRYLDPKPARSIPDIITSTKKTVVQTNGITHNKISDTKSTKSFNNPSKDQNITKNQCDVIYSKSTVMSRKSNSADNSVNHIQQIKSMYKQPLNRKISKSENMVGQQTKTAEMKKNSLIAYISPYNFRSLTSEKSQKSELYHSLKSNNSNSQINFTPKQGKRNVTNDGNFTYNKCKENTNKSPVLKKFGEISNNSTSFTQNLSRNSSPQMNKKNKNENQMLSRSMPSRERNIIKNKSERSYCKSTLSFSVKIAKKTVFEPKEKYGLNIKSNFTNTTKSSPEVSVKSCTSKIILSDSYSSNDSSINFLLERSRTFVKSEPSIINKEITMDSSIEMYPE